MKKTPLILLSLAGLITVLTFVVSHTVTTQTEKELALRTNQILLNSPTPSPKPTNRPTPTPIPSVSPTPIATVSPTSTPAPTPLSVILPASGCEVVGEYSGEMLVFHPTYSDYRIHSGIDFSGEKNTPVSAVADGVIVKNYFDYEHGYTIEIEHEEHLTSVYRNLSGTSMAQVGQVVKQGDVIGGMGNSAISESHLPYHLHFELQKNGESVNPADYFSRGLFTGE